MNVIVEFIPVAVLRYSYQLAYWSMKSNIPTNGLPAHIHISL